MKNLIAIAGLAVFLAGCKKPEIQKPAPVLSSDTNTSTTYGANSPIINGGGGGIVDIHGTDNDLIPSYYRRSVGGKYPSIYWMESEPTTFHGVCANLYGKPGEWILERPIKGQLTMVYGYKRYEQAEAQAEAFCPTKAGTK